MKAIAKQDSGVLYFNPQSKKQPLVQDLLQISHEYVYLKEDNSSADYRLAHSHWFAEVFFIPSGKGVFIVNGTQHPVSQGDLIFINPNIPHTELNRDRLAYYCLGISNVHFEVDSTTCVSNVREHYDEYVDLFERLLAEFDSDDENAQDFINNYFERFCLLIKRQFSYSLAPTQTLKATEETKNTKSNAAVEIARGYMENNMRYDIDLDQLANLTFVSKQHLIRLFTDALGYTPIQYLNRLRVSKSMYNLMLRKDSISEIANQFGFKSSYAYIKMFKKTTGYTPQQFRTKYANDIQQAEKILSDVSKIKEKNKENEQ